MLRLVHREDAGVGIPLQNGSRLGEHRPGLGSIATHGVYRRERQQQLDVAPATPLAADGHRRLATGEQHARRRRRLAVPQHLTDDPGQHDAHLASFTLNRVAEDQRVL